jgi:glycosyltransferase involved in cell wall biosynthesis
VRVGVYADLVYRRDGEVLSTDRAFVLFVTAFGKRVDELVLFGRLDPQPGRSEYELPSERVRLVPLPHYRRVTDLLGVLRSLRGAHRAFVRELDALDVVWLFGPYPVSLLFALTALRRRKRVFLGVRQDFPEYVRNRLPSRRWAWAVGVAHLFEGTYRVLSRRAPAVVVGEALGRKYPGSLALGFSLIRDEDLVDAAAAVERPWTGRIVTVGRIDSEKNPLLLPEILAELRAHDPRWTLVVAGVGPLEDAVRRRAEELGVGEALELAGYVRNGPELWDLYRSGSVFLHVSLTEGLPQVLFEAMAAGTPIVATDVGGVRAAVGDAGLVVQAQDARAAASALERLRDDAELRGRLVRSGLEQARGQTMDAQIGRILAFFQR